MIHTLANTIPQLNSRFISRSKSVNKIVEKVGRVAFLIEDFVKDKKNAKLRSFYSNLELKAR